MKTKRKILSLTISALLTTGVMSYPLASYADNDNNNNGNTTKVETKKNDSVGSKTQSASGTDSDTRGSTNNSDRKITICHVPPGNPANKHTIHIAFSAWAAHKAHTNTIGPDFADYLGSCNSRTTSTPKETIHVISGCTGTTRETLETKVQSYYEPITVADTSLDDQSVVTAMSQCLDNGDSSDSSKSNSDSAQSASGGQGKGHDSVSDSGNHHRIRGCQDKGNSSYHQTLKTADSTLDTSRSVTDPVVVSDSSLDDTGVWSAYKACVADATNANKIDSSKTGKQKGDSGHRQHILKTCGTTQDQAVRDAVTAYKAKTSTKDIIVTASAYNDVTVKAAIDACVSAGAKDTTSNYYSPNVAIPGVTITNATITNATITNGVITAGTITAGTGDIANVVGGSISAGTPSGGTTTGGTTTGNTTTGATITGATVAGATVYTGVSGRLNFRENTSPIKN